MKNIFFISTIIASLLFFSACNKSENTNSGNSGIEAFAQDERVPIAVNSLKKILSQSPNDKNFDKNLFFEENRKMKKAVLDIYNDYGEENVLKYCTKLSASEMPTKNDCCDRNQDGTTNIDCCNTWEYFLVAAGTAIRCDSDGPMEGFYDCVQERVCKNC